MGYNAAMIADLPLPRPTRAQPLDRVCRKQNAARAWPTHFPHLRQLCLTLGPPRKRRQNPAAARLPFAVAAPKGTAMKARITITLKPGVLDPQGRAIQNALGGLGFAGVAGARQGKLIELDLADGTSEATIDEMCKKLLANTVIENYRIEIL
jgi:phosphoribosylformylglycinamidine synthase